MPIIHLPVVTRPKAPAIDLQMGRPAAGSGWVNAVEKLNSKQADLKQRTAMTVRTPDWGSAVEKVSIALKQQAVAARAAAWARTVERLRSRQMALKERAATVDASGTTRECDHRNQHQALMRTGASQAA
jgi:hypothetical protein